MGGKMWFRCKKQLKCMLSNKQIMDGGNEECFKRQNVFVNPSAFANAPSLVDDAGKSYGCLRHNIQ